MGIFDALAKVVLGHTQTGRDNQSGWSNNNQSGENNQQAGRDINNQDVYVQSISLQPQDFTDDERKVLLAFSRQENQLELSRLNGEAVGLTQQDYLLICKDLQSAGFLNGKPIESAAGTIDFIPQDLTRTGRRIADELCCDDKIVKVYVGKAGSTDTDSPHDSREWVHMSSDQTEGGWIPRKPIYRLQATPDEQGRHLIGAINTFRHGVRERWNEWICQALAVIIETPKDHWYYPAAKAQRQDSQGLTIEIFVTGNDNN